MTSFADCALHLGESLALMFEVAHSEGYRCGIYRFVVEWNILGVTLGERDALRESEVCDFLLRYGKHLAREIGSVDG